ncbi:MAG: hypothetical protein IH841_06660 [Thaumarchaeota archaeon]|nr:hypothetical protein [Nitrososphaerota archaeon]
MQKSEEYNLVLKNCKRLLQEDDIRFAGVINRMGKLIVGGFKKGIKPIVDDTERQRLYMEQALRVSMREEFDYCLGPVKYCASRREKAVMISVPFNKKILLVSAEPNVDIDKTATKIMKIWVGPK